MTDIIEIRDEYGKMPTYTPHETSIFSMSREQLEEYLLKVDKKKTTYQH